MEVDGPTGSATEVDLKVAMLEYQALFQARTVSHQGGGIRFGQHLVLVSASVAFIAVLIGQDRYDKDAAIGVAAAVSSGVLVIGLITFVRLVEYTVSQNRYRDAINQIRGWFLLQSPILKPYFFMPSSAEEPYSIYGVSGAPKYLDLFVSLSGTMAIINSLCCAALVGLLVFASCPTWAAITLTVLSMIVVEAAQVAYAMWRTRSARL